MFVSCRRILMFPILVPEGGAHLSQNLLRHPHFNDPLPLERNPGQAHLETPFTVLLDGLGKCYWLWGMQSYIPWTSWRFNGG